MADSAEGGNSDENPFSFKSFVKSKKDVKSQRRKQNKTNQNCERSPSNRRKKDIFEEEVPFPDVRDEFEIIQDDVDGGNNKPDMNPFSYKHFLPDDMASRNKRVLQIIDDEVHEVKTTAKDMQFNGENDQSAEVYKFTATDTNTSETDSETESEDTSSAAMSGSVHYFVAPLDSSKAQAMVIEEVNQLKDENEKLRKRLQDSHQAKEEEKKRVSSLQRKLARIEKREADETTALENMVQMVEKNLELTTQRALRAEATIVKLKEEITILKTESVPIATYNQLLEANQSTMMAVRDKSRAASDQMNAAAKNAEQAIRQLASGADTLKFISQQLEFIDRITDVHIPEDKR